MRKPNLCTDCQIAVKKMDKSVERCWACYTIYRKKNAHGYITGNCTQCNKRLSIKKSKTGLCQSCFLLSDKAVSRLKESQHKKGCIAWNKGISIYKDKEEERQSFNAKRRERYRLMTKNDRLPELIRCRIRNAFINPIIKGGSTLELIGCDFDYFRKHIESLWLDNMNWDNYGNGHSKWNIDHIIPVSSFDLITIENQKKCFHYSNCRPMWSIDNIKKGNK